MTSFTLGLKKNIDFHLLISSNYFQNRSSSYVSMPHWVPNEMTGIAQTTFLKACSLMETFQLPVIVIGIYFSVWLTVIQYWNGQWLGDE